MAGLRSWLERRREHDPSPSSNVHAIIVRIVAELPGGRSVGDIVVWTERLVTALPPGRLTVLVERLLQVNPPPRTAVANRTNQSVAEVERTELTLRSLLRSLGHRGDVEELGSHAADRLGPCAPISEIMTVFARPPSEVAQLVLLHAAGGYRISGGWVTRLDTRKLAAAASRPSPDDGPGTLRRCLIQEGVLARYVDALVDSPLGRSLAPAIEGGLTRDYYRWNTTIADTIFNGRFAGTPVYLDLEDDALREIAQAVGSTEADASQALFASVRSTLRFTAGSVFEPHEISVRRWRADREGPPPVLALLASFSLVAEEMRRDAELNAANYYGRLAARFAVSGEKAAKLQRDYAGSAGLLWRTLNRWLLDREGELGLPTAFALDRRVHIGPALSQALVRAGDRRVLADAFTRYRLEPGADVSRDDMLDLLADWMPVAPVSATLRRLWAIADARPRIAEVACLELRAWKGVEPSIDGASAHRASSIVLIVAARRRPRPRVEFQLAIRADDAAGPLRLTGATATDMAQVLGTVSQEIDLDPPDDVGIAALQAPALSPPDVLAGLIEAVDASERAYRREPRLVVVLARDEVYGRFVEVDRARFGVELMLLVARAKESVVGRVLEASARPGFVRGEATDVVGLPEGWVAFDRVELLRDVDDPDDDVAPLRPLLRTELAISGGLRLPGPGTWHTSAPPEVRVVSLQRRRGLILQLQPTPLTDAASATQDTEERELASGDEVLIADLADAGLPAGDYRLAVRLVDAAASGRSHEAASSLFRLRDGDTPRAAPVVSHRVGDPVGALSAADGEEGVRGAWLPNVDPPSRLEGCLTPLPATLERHTWVDERAEAPASPTTPSERARTSCVALGAHHFVLPDAPGPGRARAQRGGSIKGTCVRCGYTHSFPSRLGAPLANTGHSARPALLSTPVRRAVRPIVPREQIDDDLVLDALTYAAGGGWPLFERLGSAVDDDPWSLQERARLYSALGHVDLAVVGGRCTRWSVSPPMLVASGDLAFLAGARSGRLLHAVERACDESGASIERRSQAVGPGMLVVRGRASLDDLTASVNSELGAASALRLSVGRDVPERLLSALPPLSAILGAAPEVSSHALLSASTQQYDMARMRWSRPAAIDRRRVVRIDDFPRRYLVPRGEFWREVDYRVAKWADALLAGVLPMAHDAEHERLAVPLGCQLPGLYERAVVLCSGEAPTALSDGTVAYAAVPPDVAHRVASLMRS
jgi:hypothetical protein